MSGTVYDLLNESQQTQSGKELHDFIIFIFLYTVPIIAKWQQTKEL